MTPSLSKDLRERRQKAGLTQDAAAKRLGVSRPTLTQWEAGRHRPSSEHLDKLDELYGARGELIRLAAGTRSDEQEEPSRRLYLAEVFRDVADALVEALVKDENGQPLGWSRNLADGTPTDRNLNRSTPTRLNSAYAIRTLQLLDDARVDLHSLADIFGNPTDGYGYQRENKQTRPEVTAVILATLARLGHLPDSNAALSRLQQDIDSFARNRPFVLAVVLEAVLAIRPEGELAHEMTMALLKSRKHYLKHTLWPMNSAAPPDRTTPSLAHTARATAVLRIARSTTRYQSEVDDAIGTAITWMSDPHKSDAGVIETLERTENATAISIHHFTSAWVIRSLAGTEGVPGSRIQVALTTLWGSYSRQDRLWTWRDDGSLPTWMTLDAVSALRALAEASLATPLGSHTDEARS